MPYLCFASIALPAKESGSAGRAAAMPSSNPLDKQHRPRAYDRPWPPRYQWVFDTIPPFIRRGGRDVDNPFRRAVLFVVHGMGEQRLGETAATLRIALEDTVPTVQPVHGHAAQDFWYVPQPYIYEGHWSDYANIAATATGEWADFSEEQRRFFARVWEQRSVSAWRSVLWLVRNGTKLFVRGRGLAKLYYAYLVPLLWAIAVLMLFHSRTRVILQQFVNDARIYFEPQGDTELEIVQRIDQRVGAAFLGLLGYDWDFEPIPARNWVRIGRAQHRFDRVTWVAHSLGTVISYNVISDILHRSAGFRARAEKLPACEAIERGLGGFVTIGSPLDKISFLYGQEVLRPWPPEYLPGGALDLWRNKDGGGFWQNFHYTSDPISGPLDAFRDAAGRNLVTNYHTRGRRLWGLSHVLYWSDQLILARILRVAFGDLVSHRALRLRSPAMQRISLLLSFGFLRLAAPAVVLSLLYLAYALGNTLGKTLGLW